MLFRIRVEGEGKGANGRRGERKEEKGDNKWEGIDSEGKAGGGGGGGGGRRSCRTGWWRRSEFFRAVYGKC